MSVQGRRRQGSGEGSVYQRGDGKWVAQVGAGRLESGRRRYTRAVRASEKEARKALRDLLRQADAGLTIDNTRTVSAYLTWWADNVLAGTVKKSTEDDYRGVIKRWIDPAIGNVRLGQLRPVHVQKMLRTMETDELSPRSRQYARAILVRALRWADQTGLIDRNPAALVDGPKLSRAAKLDDAMTADQARTLIAHAKDHRLHALVVLLLRLGLRRGEALALTWDRIDFDNMELTIAGTLKYRAGKLGIDTPKTAAGYRTLPLLADVEAALRSHRRKQAAERLKAGDLWRDTGYVFTDEQGAPIVPQSISTWWPKLTAEAGLGHRRCHSSRHTAATLLLDQGVQLEVVSAILGHASLSITSDVYAKVTQDSKRKALRTMDAALGSNS